MLSIEIMGIVVLATGALLSSIWVALGGGAVIVIGIYAWAFEPFEV